MSSIDVKRGDIGAITLSLTAKETGWKSSYSLLPEREYAIVWSAAYNKAGEYVDRTEGDDYQSWSGILVPTKSRNVHYVKGNKVGYTTECVVEWCKTSAKQIPNSLFSHELPDDAVVIDMDKKITIRNTEATQRDWDEIVQLIGPPKTHWWLWGSVAIAAGLAVLALLAFKRRARGQSAKPAPI